LNSVLPSLRLPDRMEIISARQLPSGNEMAT